MLTNKECFLVLERALKEKGDFAELFFEDTEETQIVQRSGVVQRVKGVRTYGVGLYLLDQTDSIYVYTNEVTLEALLALADRACELMEDKKRSAPVQLVCPQRQNPDVFSAVAQHQADHAAKIRRMIEADHAIRSSGVGIQNLNIHYFDSDQRVRVVNSEGLLADDRRVSTRMRYDLTVGDGIRNAFRWEDLYKPGDFSTFIDHDEHISFGIDLAHRLENTRSARAISPCRVPVILEAGVCGTLFHECCGHMLEGCAIAARRSPFVGMIGQRVASDKVTLVDDGTVPGALGSSLIDDEGHPRQRNVLIEKGILKGYLNDRLNGRKLGTGSNGCGRRQNYTYAPTSRMSNTFLLTGTDDNDQMFSEIDQGLYVRSVGGGNGGAQFSIAVADGFWIEHGKITYPVKGVSLTGSGIDVMQKIDRVGTQLGSFDGSFCGAASGLIPTTVNQPRIRISQMSLG